VRRIIAILGIAVGLALCLAGIAFGAVGLMAMGAETPKLIVFLEGALLLVLAVALIASSAVSLQRSRARTSA
jgi:hypothetical protein